MITRRKRTVHIGTTTGITTSQARPRRFCRGCTPGLRLTQRLLRSFYDELVPYLRRHLALPEYYLTRAENEIIERYANEIASSVDGHITLLEMGSGSASKTKLIVEALLNKQNDLLFIPVDISASALNSSSRILLQSFPRLRIEAYAADYFDALSALSAKNDAAPRTLSWFKHKPLCSAAPAFCVLAPRAWRSDAFCWEQLLKRTALAEPAYDDALGITAAST